MSAEGSVLWMRPSCVFMCEGCGNAFHVFSQHSTNMTAGGNGAAEVQHCQDGQVERIFGPLLYMEGMCDGEWVKIAPYSIGIPY
jgi:hypothetical protein